jgi:formamidopyrimidine-DNA glycosylase
MPELPEVETVVSELNQKLKNLTIKSVVVNTPKIISVGPAVVSNRRQASSLNVQKFIKLLQGKQILSVTRRSKLLIFHLSPPSPQPSPKGRGGEGEIKMLVHLKMTGQFIFEDKKLRAKTNSHYRLLNKLSAPLAKLPSKHTHVVFNFTNSETLYFNDIRKFGYLKVVTDAEFNNIKELKQYGPEPLEKSFNLEKFLELVKRVKTRKTSIKQLLMDNSFVVGIGNIYSDEILFHAKVNPKRKVLSIKDSEWKEIFKNIKPILLTAIKAKGSSVGDFVRTDGSWGQMGKHHFVYGRRGQKCKKCVSIIQSIKLGGRTASFCPNCQK